MQQTLYSLDTDPTWFPDPRFALTEPAGLLAIGGDLSPTRVYHGYQQGIFPWFSEDEPLLWWSPDPRAVLWCDKVRINKSLTKFLRKCDYTVSINQAFSEVIRHCAKPRPNSEGTWILPEMVKCYQQLHQDGKAHSIEIWSHKNNQLTLVGGLYGVLVGHCFCGESMFSLTTNASKLALITLARILEPLPDSFIDCQLENPYLMSMGAELISRDLYLQKLKQAKQKTAAKPLFSPKFIEW